MAGEEWVLFLLLMIATLCKSLIVKGALVWRRFLAGSLNMGLGLGMEYPFSHALLFGQIPKH